MDNVSATPAVSVIIPVYNGRRDLPGCLESVSRQSFSDFECIIVDDGSTDDSPAICDAFARKDGRFRVIHQANAGPSKARFRGVDEARGEYICFVDADDFVPPEGLAILHRALVKTGAKVVLGSVQAVLPNGKTYLQKFSPADEGEDMLSYVFFKGGGAFYGKMTQRTLLLGMETADSKVGEDVYFLYQLFARITWKELCTVDDVVYVMQPYSFSSVSATHLVPFSAKSIEESPYSVNELNYAFLRDHAVSDAAMAAFIGSPCNGYLQLASFYLVMNKLRPARSEIEQFYRLWKQYEKTNKCHYYTKSVIPLFYYLMPVRGLLAVLLRLGVKVFVLFRRLRRLTAPFRPELAG